jgi:subtilisin family serine protease
VRHLFLGIASLILIMSSLTNSIEPNSNFAFAAPLLYHNSDTGPLSLLVEGFDRIGPREAGTLSDFGTVTTVAGQVAVVRTDAQDLQDIVRLPFVSNIQRSRPLHLYLDKSVPDIGANTVWHQVRDSLGRNVTGQGTIIGFVDTGIDITHPDFTFPNGTTKIVYVWDQTIHGRPPSPFGYGYECTSIDIQARTCPETDTFGHGTHVAGIAASSGRATGNYTGVAPGASIILVKSGYEVCEGTSWTFDTTQILDGINYIVMKAKQLGRPVVINLSLGGNIGGHDGSDPLELALDEFVKGGTPIVVAAGNGAYDNAHIRGRLSEGGNVTFRVGVMENTTDLAIDIWYSTRDEVDATLSTPSGRSFTIPVPTGQTTTSNGNVTTQGTRSDHGRELYFEVNSTSSLPTQGWSVTLRAQQISVNGTWDAWVDTASCSYPGASLLTGSGYSIDQYDTIGIPGTAHYVVTVGAYVTKTSWRGVNGQYYGSNSALIGEIASFSSRGPTRDGRVKPDVVAPGSLIASARSSAVPESPSDPDAFHRILAGTSMAAPHVAGTIALMLQYSPGLQATQLPEILRSTARLDAQTGFLQTGSPIWGFGKIDAKTATGFFRVTPILDGLPLGTALPVQFDDTQLEITNSSWSHLYFARGTVHTLAINESYSTSEGLRYRLADVKYEAGQRSIDMMNNPITASTIYMWVNETGFVVLSYEPVPAPSTLILVLPSIAFLVLAVGIFSFGLEFFLRRRNRPASTEG